VNRCRRVVITGIGVVSPIGNGVHEYWDSLTSGKSGIGMITHFDASEFSCKIGGEVKDLNFDDYIAPERSRKMSRTSKLAVVAAKMSLGDSGLVLSEEEACSAGLVLGVASGDATVFSDNVIRRFRRGEKGPSPIWPALAVTTAPTGNVAIELGISGEVITISTGCSSSTNAIGHAYRKIKFGLSDIVFAGGSEVALQEDFLVGYSKANALSRRNEDPLKASRPFDRDRDGQVLSEAAGFFVLEEYERAKLRGAKIYGEIVGYGISNDSVSMLTVSDDVKHAARSLQMALNESETTRDRVDYYCAHGSSGPKTDTRETNMLKSVFKKKAYRTPISSVKSMTGHPFGAAGVLQASACALSIKNHAVPPTINYETPDPECDLDYIPNEARSSDVELAMSYSLGAGGNNASLLFAAC